MSRFAPCLLLLCLSATTSARETRLFGADGNGGSCPEIAAAEAEADTPSTKPRTAAANASRGKAAKPSGARGGDAQRMQAPRWHSFLPGMFR